jgi:hypothetical protein
MALRCSSAIIWNPNQFFLHRKYLIK